MSKKQVKGMLFCSLLVAAVASFTISATAQEFRGFYSNTDKVKNSEPSSRSYRSRYSYDKYSGYLPSNSLTLRFSNDKNYDGSSYPNYEENRFPYPPRDITINIFSPDYSPVAGRPDYNNYNGGYYRNNNGIPFGAKTIKINGERFYEMNGNYYHADGVVNTRSFNYRTNNRDDKYYIVKGDDRVYSVNPDYVTENNSGARTVFVTDGYKSDKEVYTKKDAYTTIATLQQEKRLLQSENDDLKQKERDRLKMYKDDNLVPVERQNERMKISDDEQNYMKQQARDFEQLQRLQQMRRDNDMKELQAAQKAEDRRSQDVYKNNKSNQEIFYRTVSVGDLVDEVPPGSKTITIDGKKTYLSPANNYYQKQKNGKYLVVGMEGK